MTLAWIFFRAENVGHAFSYIGEIFSESFFSIPAFSGKRDALIIFGLICVFLFIEWLGRNDKNNINNFISKFNVNIRVFIYYVIFLLIIWFWLKGDDPQFIYFQF